MGRRPCGRSRTLVWMGGHQDFLLVEVVAPFGITAHDCHTSDRPNSSELFYGLPPTLTFPHCLVDIAQVRDLAR